MQPRQRDLCLRCNRARETCFCKYTQPFATRTRFIILMHPREFKRQRTGTGRVTRQSLLNSEILMGIDFTHHEALNQVLEDDSFFPVLLFPGETVVNLSSQQLPELANQRRLLVIILDATWAGARKMLRSSANLLRLPRITFDFHDESRFLIKRQPKTFCLSTIEATYRLLDVLKHHGYETLHEEHHALMQTLDAIVKFQLACETDPKLPSHRLGKKLAEQHSRQ